MLLWIIHNNPAVFYGIIIIKQVGSRFLKLRPLKSEKLTIFKNMNGEINNQAANEVKMPVFWVLLRLSMGWLFFWPFLDKLFGLGFATKPESAWVGGGSPTFGFLKFAAKGPFAEFFQSLAGNVFVDWIFMVGLLLIGLALFFGVGMKIAGYSGALMLVLMYAAGFIPPEHNPFLDDHLVYAFLMLGLVYSGAGKIFGLGKWWANTGLVRKMPVLE